jgi:TorA maturation chaperone TorD
MERAETRQDRVVILLANRVYLYRLLQNFFGNEPGQEILEFLNSDHTQTAFSLLAMEQGPALTKYFAEDEKAGPGAALDRIRSEYTRLLIGPARLPAPPWESVYVAKERLIFQESTLKVRQCYLKYHYLPVHYRSEADDHLALELDFMAKLSQLAANAFENGRSAETVEILNDQKVFLEEHLLVWVPQFSKVLQGATSHPLFRIMASVLQQYLETDRLVIVQISDTL